MIYRIMHFRDMITKSSAKSNKREWIRFECTHSLMQCGVIGIS